jgi:hypothetical protein
MEWTIRTFVEARDATERLLDELGLGTYLFDVEPRDEGWVVKLEYQDREGWKVVRVAVDREWLERSLHDDTARALLRERLRGQLGGTASAAREQG